MDIKKATRILTIILMALTVGLAFGLQNTRADHAISKDEYQLFQEGLRCHHEGDYSEAIRCWLPLAETGVAEAQYNVGRMYAYGEGAKKDYVEAYAWFILSARNGRIEGRTAMDELKPHMSPEEISRAYERASVLEALSEWPGS